jgi:hypothetical protein
MDMKTIDDRTIFIQACGQVIRLPNQEDSVKPDDYLMVNVFKYILDYSLRIYKEINVKKYKKNIIY